MTYRLLPLLLSMVAMQSCRFGMDEASIPTRTETQSIDRDKSEMVRVDLRMAAGEMKVHPGAAGKLMDAAFTYNVASWKPEVRYNATGFRGTLNIEQHATSGGGHHDTKNIWDIQLNDQVPLDVIANMGAGEGRLDLGGLSLRSVQVNLGAGSVRLDLRGEPKHDYDVQVRGGVGEADIWLPRTAGVVAEASGGLGGIKADGFTQRNGKYYNDAYEKAQVRIHLDVKGGIGQINLHSE